MTNQTSRVAILLQNRADFYRFALARFHAEHLRARLSAFQVNQDIDLTELNCGDGGGDLLAGLALEDPLKKPDFGEKWGRTVISYSEFFDRAKTLEQIVLLASYTLDVAKYPIVGDLQALTESRLRSLVELEDSLRYHRLRLLKT